MTVFRAATLRTFFFAFHAGGKELNEFGLGLRLGLVTTFFLIYSLGGHSCNTDPNPNPNPNPNSF